MTLHVTKIAGSGGRRRWEPVISAFLIARAVQCGNSWKRVIEGHPDFSNGSESFDDMLIREMSLITDAARLDAMRALGKLWQRFSNCFPATDGRFSYLPFFKRYMRKIVEHFTNLVPTSAPGSPRNERSAATRRTNKGIAAYAHFFRYH